jgi:hypothetical protein
MLEVAGPGEAEARVFSTDEFKPPLDPESWKFPDAAELYTNELQAADPDLARVAPARVAGPGDKKKKKSQAK